MLLFVPLGVLRAPRGSIVSLNQTGAAPRLPDARQGERTHTPSPAVPGIGWRDWVEGVVAADGVTGLVEFSAKLVDS